MILGSSQLHKGGVRGKRQPCGGMHPLNPMNEGVVQGYPEEMQEHKNTRRFRESCIAEDLSD